ncbi:hypothetical protein [Gimesia aquarii]|uniref:hypothetical protein n=1 Tax=Gimesia aquarii TaxID=2527964 RepID=UPI00119FEE2D|nr:hypothetical protein [Gimesia aquarii]
MLPVVGQIALLGQHVQVQNLVNLVVSQTMELERVQIQVFLLAAGVGSLDSFVDLVQGQIKNLVLCQVVIFGVLRARVLLLCYSVVIKKLAGLEQCSVKEEYVNVFKIYLFQLLITVEKHAHKTFKLRQFAI